MNASSSIIVGERRVNGFGADQSDLVHHHCDQFRNDKGVSIAAEGR